MQGKTTAIVEVSTCAITLQDALC